jgi:hypothetical protein
MEVIGMPPNNMIDEAKRKRIFFGTFYHPSQGISCITQLGIVSFFARVMSTTLLKRLPKN